jgi:hypothetical protein
VIETEYIFLIRYSPFVLKKLLVFTLCSMLKVDLQNSINLSSSNIFNLDLKCHKYVLNSIPYASLLPARHISLIADASFELSICDHACQYTAAQLV